MSSKIIAGTTSGTALNMSADTSGILEIQTGSGPTTAITVDANQRSKFPTTIGVGNATPATTGSGITFPATQSASSDANTLDDYEEGSWTPIWNGGTVTPARCQYVKIGKQVTITFDLSMGTPSGSAALTITGLPFIGDAGNQSTGSIMWNNINLTSYISATAYIYGGSADMNFYKLALYGSWATINNNDLPSSTRIIGSSTYFIG